MARDRVEEARGHQAGLMFHRALHKEMGLAWGAWLDRRKAERYAVALDGIVGARLSEVAVCRLNTALLVSKN